MQTQQPAHISKIINRLPDTEEDNDSQPRYPQTYSLTSQKSTDYRLKRKPLIQARETPESIIGDNKETVKKILIGWGRVRERLTWNEYTEKINPETKEMLAEVFAELRRNGFYNYRVREDKIICDYVCYGKDEKHQETLNICTLCERECSRKDWKGVFHTDHKGNEVSKCWE